MMSLLGLSQKFEYLNVTPPAPPPQAYYSDLLSQLRVGPPLFLVVRGLNVTPESHDINNVCSVSGCSTNSLLNQVCVGGIRL